VKRTYLQLVDDAEDSESDGWDEYSEEEGERAFNRLARGGVPADPTALAADDRSLEREEGEQGREEGKKEASQVKFLEGKGGTKEANGQLTRASPIPSVSTPTYDRI
jgi:hypothetical protein